MKRNMMAAGVVVMVAGLAGCGGGANEQITRVDPDAMIDISSGFNQNDARLQVRQLVSDAMGRAWITDWMSGHQGAKPMMVLGGVKNQTGDYTINTGLMTDEIQREVLNSGRVRVIAAKEIRQELNAERFDTEFADPTTMGKAASHLKANLMLLGVLREVTQVSGDGRSKVRYFELVLEMTDVQTAEKVWIGTGKVQKTSQR